MIEIARDLDFAAKALRVEPDYVRSMREPCILHWQMNHFVVLGSVSKRGAEIYDPVRGKYQVSWAEFSTHFTGVLLRLRPGEHFTRIREVRPVSWRNLTGKLLGVRRVFLQVFLLALAIELIALLLPFQMQVIVDQVLPSEDKRLLVVVGISFAALVTANFVLTLCRAWLITWTGSSINVQWTSNIFGHLLSLPLEYFEKRHMADIVSRFSSITAIQRVVTGNFIEAILNGVIGSLAFAILCFYNMELTIAVAVVLGIYAGLRAALFSKAWRLNGEQLVFAARQQSELIESIQGVQAIKLGNKQEERLERLSQATHDSAVRDMGSQRINMFFTAVNQWLFGLTRVWLLATGCYFTLSGKFSVGMLVAYVAYADQLTQKVGKLIDRWVDFKVLGLHAQRLADIALTTPEAKTGRAASALSVRSSDVRVRNVSFRYSESDPWVLRNVSLEIRAGESVAIVGSSGSGKTTLAKVLLGLLDPTEGVVEVGSVDIKALGLRRYREIVAAVMQEDHLFNGTIADNIVFFDPDAQFEDIEASARAAGIHDEIEAMPMGYETFVGFMGSSLSGGQKQRVLLARALYRRPKILVLDEATSHLDLRNEAHINHSIRNLEVTRIIIAHRPDTIASADRAIYLDGP